MKVWQLNFMLYFINSEWTNLFIHQQAFRMTLFNFIINNCTLFVWKNVARAKYTPVYFRNNYVSKSRHPTSVPLDIFLFEILTVGIIIIYPLFLYLYSYTKNSNIIHNNNVIFNLEQIKKIVFWVFTRQGLRFTSLMN